jgi:hypothetical protein
MNPAEERSETSLNAATGKHGSERGVKRFGEKFAPRLPKFFGPIYPPKTPIFRNALTLTHFTAYLR